MDKGTFSIKALRKIYILRILTIFRGLELTLSLSNVTAGFYGFTLEYAGQQCGWDKVDSISRALFRELGKLKTKEALI